MEEDDYIFSNSALPLRRGQHSEGTKGIRYAHYDVNNPLAESLKEVEEENKEKLLVSQIREWFRLVWVGYVNKKKRRALPHHLVAYAYPYACCWQGEGILCEQTNRSFATRPGPWPKKKQYVVVERDKNSSCENVKYHEENENYWFDGTIGKDYCKRALVCDLAPNLPGFVCHGRRSRTALIRQELARVRGVLLYEQGLVTTLPTAVARPFTQSASVDGKCRVPPGNALLLGVQRDVERENLAVTEILARGNIPWGKLNAAIKAQDMEGLEDSVVLAGKLFRARSSGTVAASRGGRSSGRVRRLVDITSIEPAATSVVTMATADVRPPQRQMWEGGDGEEGEEPSMTAISRRSGQENETGVFPGLLPLIEDYELLLPDPLETDLPHPVGVDGGNWWHSPDVQQELQELLVPADAEAAAVDQSGL